MFELLFNVYTLAIFMALLPVGLLFYYIYRQDSVQPEPTKLLWRGVWYGVCSAFIVAFGYGSIWSSLGLDGVGNTVLGAVFEAFFGAAIPEEAAKLFFLWLLLRRNKYFDEHLDGIVYATCVGLGFAGLENIFYLIGNIDSLVMVAIVRALFSVPGHFFFAVAMGYFISIAHFGSTTPEQKRRNYLLAFLVPMALHGLFDALLMVQSAAPLLSLFCSIAFCYFVHYLRKVGIARIKNLKERDAYVRYNENYFKNGTTTEQ